LLFFMLFVIPLVGALWFLNLVSLLKKLHESRNPQNERILGAVLTFLLLFSLMFVYLSQM